MSPFENRQTLLQFGVRKEQFEMIKLLLALGADPLVLDGEGMPTAIYASRPDADRSVMEAIRVQAGSRHDDAALSQAFVASVSLADWDDATRRLREKPTLLNEGALHLMAKRGDTRAVQWLLARGADPNALWAHWDADLTAMHLAAWQGHAEIVRLLLDAGGDPSIRDTKHDGDVSGWADHGGHPDIAAMVAAR
jgi:ankyrin repeat protein